MHVIVILSALGLFLMLDTTGHFAHTIAMLTAPPAGVERGSDSKG